MHFRKRVGDGVKVIDVYICEDIKKQRDQITNYVKAAILIHEYDMKVKLETDNPDEIIQTLKKAKNTGLYFLDIDLKNEKNGITLAREIRDYDPRGFIVFITSHAEMTFLTFQYKVEAMDYILKDEPQALQMRIGECMENVIDRYRSISKGEGRTITIACGEHRIILKHDEIIFFETSINEHKLILHTCNKSIEFLGKIKEIEVEMGEGFIRCHRSYLVNKRKIKEVNFSDKIIIMLNGSICPISSRGIGHVKKCLSKS